MAAKPDLTEFYKLSRPKKRPCQVGFGLTQVSEEDKTAYDAADKLDPGVITNAALQGWLGARKHDVSIPVIVSQGTHRG